MRARLFTMAVLLRYACGPEVLPEQGPWGLLVRTPSIGGAENAAYFAYPHHRRAR